MSEDSKYLRWWEAYTYPLQAWETDDLEDVKKAVTSKPPNKSIEHPMIVGFLGGFFQAMGELGYLECKVNSIKIFVPFVSVYGNDDVINTFIRLVGDFQEAIEVGGLLRITITGLRAIIFLRIISPVLMGKIREVAEKIIWYGYKITDIRKLETILCESSTSELEEVGFETVRFLKRIIIKGVGLEKISVRPT